MLPSLRTPRRRMTRMTATRMTMPKVSPFSLFFVKIFCSIFFSFLMLIISVGWIGILIRICFEWCDWNFAFGWTKGGKKIGFLFFIFLKFGLISESWSIRLLRLKKLPTVFCKSKYFVNVICGWDLKSPALHSNSKITVKAKRNCFVFWHVTLAYFF